LRFKSAILITAALALPKAAIAAMVGNPLCPAEEVSFNSGNGEDIVVLDGFRVSVFASGLNFPTGIAFRGDALRFEVYVLESGAFPASRCNNAAAWQAKTWMRGPSPRKGSSRLQHADPPILWR
jgi:hypothetical protein